VREDGRTVALDMLVEPDAGASLGHDRCERGLADLKRIAPQVVAVLSGAEEMTVTESICGDLNRVKRPNCLAGHVRLEVRRETGKE
jgi:hypothetical protein